MKKILLSLVLLLPLLFFTRSAFADVVCQPVYGGGQTCVTTGNVQVNKKVQNPQTGQFVDNLNATDPRFTAGQIVTFQITLTNTGSTTIQQVAVRDVFPSFLTFQSGPGSFDANARTLTFTTDLLGPGEVRNFTITGTILDAKGLPDGINCVVNQVTATTNTGQMSQDNTQFCIQKAVTTTKGGLPIVSPSPMPTTPPTGPEALAWFALLPGGAMGWLLRKKSQFLDQKKEGGEK